MRMERGVEGVRAGEARDSSLSGGAWRGVGWTLGLALAAGLLLRVWFMLHYARIAGDALVYGDIARNVLEHHVYGFSETLNGAAAAPKSTLIRLPGYPLFLAACFRAFGMEHYTAVLLVQIAVDLWTCLLLGGVAARIFSKRGQRAGVAAVWLGAVCPFTANYTTAPLTETLTLFCMALAFYAVARWRERGAGVNRWVFVLGLALSYAILLRPEQGLLAAAILPGMLWIAGRRATVGIPQGLVPHSSAEPDRPRTEASRSLETNGRMRYVKALRPVVLAALLTVLPLGPWALRNWIAFHVFQPLAPRYANDPGEVNPYGFQRWYRTWAIEFASTEDVYWNYDGSPIDLGDLPDRAFDTQAQAGATEALLDDYNENNVATPALDRRFNAIADERIHTDALRYYVGLPLARVLNMALRPRTEMLPVPLEWWKFQEHRRACVLAAVFAGLNLAYFALAGIGFARVSLRPEQRVLVWSMLATIGLRAALLLTLDNSEPRYTLEFFPVLIALGAGVWMKSPLKTDN